MKFTFTLTIDLDRTGGRAASRDEMTDRLRELICEANPGTLDGDAGGEYEIIEWDVTEDMPAVSRRRS